MEMLSKVDTIKQKILDDIRQGRLKPGEPLYSRHQFMTRYGCSRGSIDTAIKELSESGYVYSRQGAGTYVAETFPATRDITRFFVVENFRKAYTADDFLYSSYIVSEIQRLTPCFLYRADEININLRHIVRPGSGVIWLRPSYDKMMQMDYIASGGVPQVLIGRRFGDYDYIDTDSRESVAEGLEWLKYNAGPELAFIARSYKTDFPYIAERQTDFYEALVGARMTIRPEWLHVRDFFDIEGELNLIADRLFSDPKTAPRAIYIDFCDIVPRFVAMAELRGFLPGRDYFLVAFDYIESLDGRQGIGLLAQRQRAMEDKAVEWAVSPQLRGSRIGIKPDFLHW